MKHVGCIEITRHETFSRNDVEHALDNIGFIVGGTGWVPHPTEPDLWVWQEWTEIPCGTRTES